MLNGDGCYKKHVIINNIPYDIIIPKDIWDSLPHKTIQNHVSYVIRQMKKGTYSRLKYGSITRNDTEKYKCSECNIHYKTHSGYFKHVRKHHSDTSTEIAKPPEPINERVTSSITHITNNTQNINIHLPQIRNFRDENPKWLTHDLLMRVIQNIPTAIPNLIKEKHFNDKFPENQNIRLDNKRNMRSRLRVYDEGRWRIEDRPDIEFRVIEQVYDVMREFIEMMAEDADDADNDDDDNELSPIEKRVAHITRRIRASEMRSRRVRRLLGSWERFDDSIQSDYEKVVEPFKHRIDTFLLDNELRLEQLRERQASLLMT